LSWSETWDIGGLWMMNPDATERMGRLFSP
jgi:hypothetical protein